MRFQIHDEVRYSDTFVATAKSPEMADYLRAHRGVVTRVEAISPHTEYVSVAWQSGGWSGTFADRLTLVHRPPDEDEDEEIPDDEYRRLVLELAHEHYPEGLHTKPEVWEVLDASFYDLAVQRWRAERRH